MARKTLVSNYNKMLVKKTIAFTSHEVQKIAAKSHVRRHALTHNDIVMQIGLTMTLKIDTLSGPYSGEVLIYAGKLHNPDATLHVTNTSEELEEMKETQKHIEILFAQRQPSRKQRNEKVEYM